MVFFLLFICSNTKLSKGGFDDKQFSPIEKILIQNNLSFFWEGNDNFFSLTKNFWNSGIDFLCNNINSSFWN